MFGGMCPPQKKITAVNYGTYLQTNVFRTGVKSKNNSKTVISTAVILILLGNGQNMYACIFSFIHYGFYIVVFFHGSAGY